MFNEKPKTRFAEKRKSSPESLVFFFKRIFEKYVNLNKVEIEGLENIKLISPTDKTIIASTHLYDLDLPVVTIKLGEYFDILVTNESGQYDTETSPLTAIGMQIGGKDSFLPVAYKKTADNKNKPLMFSTKNFEPMEKKLTEGKAIVIAAHNPAQKPHAELENLKGGYGAVYLAAKTGAWILPVFVKLSGSDSDFAMHEDWDKITVKLNAKIIIGKPYKLNPIKNLDGLTTLETKRAAHEPLTAKDKEEFVAAKNGLQTESEGLMMRLIDQQKG